MKKRYLSLALLCIASHVSYSMEDGNKNNNSILGQYGISAKDAENMRKNHKKAKSSEIDNLFNGLKQKYKKGFVKHIDRSTKNIFNTRNINASAEEQLQEVQEMQKKCTLIKTLKRIYPLDLQQKKTSNRPTDFNNLNLNIDEKIKALILLNTYLTTITNQKSNNSIFIDNQAEQSLKELANIENALTLRVTIENILKKYNKN